MSANERLFALALAWLAPLALAAERGDDYFPSRLCARPVMPISTVSPSEPGVRYWTQTDPADWSAELTKERLTADGKTMTSWRASEQLTRRRQLRLASGFGSPGLKDFRWAELDETQRAVLNTDAHGAFDGYGTARVALLNGESCADLEGCLLLRQNLPKLGDVINSAPLLIAAPDRQANVMEQYDGPAGAYAAYQARPRRAQLYLSANDGRLHVFDAATGEERLAVIPSTVLHKLSALTSPRYAKGVREPHRYLVDGPLVSQDVFYDGAWHTVLLISMGAGGRGLLALDVSDPDNIVQLWEYSASNDPTLGYLLAAPTIARLHTGQWAVLLGNGIDAPDATAALLILDIRSGALIRRIATSQPAAGLAMPLVTDVNSDGNADYAYAGDSLGNLWRFDLFDTSHNSLQIPQPPATVSANNFRLSFAGNPLFTAPTREGSEEPQAITLAPAVVRHPSGLGYLIVFGTGQNHLAANSNQQSLYAIWDRQTAGQQTGGADNARFNELQEQRIAQPLHLTNTAIAWQMPEHAPLGKRGWYIDLQPAGAGAAGERLFQSPLKRGELLFVHTRIPSALPCQHDVARRLYAIDPRTGGSAAFPVFDVNGDGRVDETDLVDGVPPTGISVGDNVHIVADPVSGTPCLVGDNGCAPVSLGPRANGRQSWRVITDVTP